GVAGVGVRVRNEVGYPSDARPRREARLVVPRVELHRQTDALVEAELVPVGVEEEHVEVLEVEQRVDGALQAAVGADAEVLGVELERASPLRVVLLELLTRQPARALRPEPAASRMLAVP